MTEITRPEFIAATDKEQIMTRMKTDLLAELRPAMDHYATILFRELSDLGHKLAGPVVSTHNPTDSHIITFESASGTTGPTIRRLVLDLRVYVLVADPVPEGARIADAGLPVIQPPPSPVIPGDYSYNKLLEAAEADELLHRWCWELGQHIERGCTEQIEAPTVAYVACLNRSGFDFRQLESDDWSLDFRDYPSRLHIGTSEVASVLCSR